MIQIKPCPRCGDKHGLYVFFEKHRANPERAYCVSWEDALENFKSSPASYIDYPCDIACVCGYGLEVQKDFLVTVLVWNALDRRQKFEKTSGRNTRKRESPRVVG